MCPSPHSLHVCACLSLCSGEISPVHRPHRFYSHSQRVAIILPFPFWCTFLYSSQQIQQILSALTIQVSASSIQSLAYLLFLSLSSLPLSLSQCIYFTVIMLLQPECLVSIPTPVIVLYLNILQLSIQYCFMEIYMKSQLLLSIVVVYFCCSLLYRIFGKKILTRFAPRRRHRELAGRAI